MAVASPVASFRFNRVTLSRRLEHGFKLMENSQMPEALDSLSMILQPDFDDTGSSLDLSCREFLQLLFMPLEHHPHPCSP